MLRRQRGKGGEILLYLKLVSYKPYFPPRKRENHAKMVKDLQTSNEEMSRALQVSGKSMRRSLNAVKEMFAQYGILWFELVFKFRFSGGKVLLVD